jgi:hypothetical protein
LIYTQIQAQARKSPFARVQARFASPKVNSHVQSLKIKPFCMWPGSVVEQTGSEAVAVSVQRIMTAWSQVGTLGWD